MDAPADRTRHQGHPRYDWAWLDVRPDDAPDGNRNEKEPGTSVLVARRHRYTGEVSFFRCWAPGDVSLGTLVGVICRRWRNEETFQLAKGFTGLDQGQVACRNPWMRWSLFSLIAAAVLALTATAVHDASKDEPVLVPLSCPELIRLLRALVLPPPAPRARAHPARDRMAMPSPSRRNRLPPATTPPSRPTVIKEPRLPWLTIVDLA